MNRKTAIMGMAVSMAQASLADRTFAMKKPKKEPLVIIVEDDVTDERVMKAIEEIKIAYPDREVIARPLKEMPEEYKPNDFDFQAAIIAHKQEVKVEHRIKAEPKREPSKYELKLLKRYQIQEREALKNKNKGVR